MRKTLREQVLKILCCTLGLSLSVSFFTEARAQVSGTYTINSALPTGGTNFQSFTDAVSYLSAGVNGAVVFNVQAGSGPYTEQVQLNNIGGTSAANTITFNCNGVTLKFLSTNSSQRAGIKLNNTSYVTFNNLVITPQAAGSTQYGYGFHLLNNSDYNVIRNCRITLNTAVKTSAVNLEGIVINGSDLNSTAVGNSNCDYNVIQNNTITGGGTGITLASKPATGANPVFMQSNQVLNNAISNIYSSCIQLYYNDGAIVDGNDLQSGTDADARIVGLYIVNVNQNCQFTKNRIHHFWITSPYKSVYGILYSSEGASGKPNLIANNLLYDFSSDYEQYGIAARYGVTSFANIYNNTVSLDDHNTDGASSEGLYFLNAYDMNVMNNIVTVTRQVSDWNYGIYFGSLPTRVICARNVYWVPAGNSADYGIGVIGGYAATTILDWRKLSGTDMHSVSIDPQYSNPLASNYKPTAQPIDNMAQWENLITDIVGVTRSTLNPDPGCYEFVTAACQTPVVTGANELYPDTVICEGSQLSFGLDGNSWGVGQTYTWQTSSTINGTYTDITSPLAYPAYDKIADITRYYRVALTCLSSTAYTTPIRVTVNPLLRAGTYTINSALPTAGSNFHSFNDAVLAMQCGITGSVVFNVTPGSGPYNEQVIIPEINYTSATSTITINGNGATIQYAATDNNQMAVIKLKGTDYLTIDSLNVAVNGSSFGVGIQMLNRATHNTIKRCKVLMSVANSYIEEYAGIVINSADDVIIDLNTSNYCDSNVIMHDTVIGGTYGIVCASQTGLLLFAAKGNTISYNTLQDQASYGIYLAGNNLALVEGNEITQPARPVGAYSAFDGIFLNQSVFASTITRNRIHNLSGASKTSIAQITGIYVLEVNSAANVVNYCTNNEVYDFKGTGLHQGLYTKNSNYLKFYHNTISLDDSTSGFTTVTSGLNAYGNASTGVEFKDNNVVIKRSGTGTRYGIFLADTAAKADYNNYWVVPADGTGTNGTSYVAGRIDLSTGTEVPYKTLNDWRVLGKDLNSISIDPLFQSIDSGNFTPTAIPFENKGSWAGIPIDIYDSIRNTTKPDVGAVEFTICWPLETPVLTIDSIGVSALRFRWTPVTYTPGYLVSRDGINWATPTSGKLGLTHTISGLHARDTVGLMVKAIGTRWDCPVVYSNRIVGQTLTDQIFIPNTFTPNGNKTNDEFRVYSNIVQTLRLIVYNQWGEKVFETNDVNGAWDGTYKGKPAPIGIYVYVAVMTTTEPEIPNVTRKGTFNLIR